VINDAAFCWFSAQTMGDAPKFLQKRRLCVAPGADLLTQ
jgi:hypothetical protein